MGFNESDGASSIQKLCKKVSTEKCTGGGGRGLNLDVVVANK